MSQTLEKLLPEKAQTQERWSGWQWIIALCYVLLPFPGYMLWWRPCMLGIGALAVQQSEGEAWYCEQSFIDIKYSSTKRILQSVEQMLWEEGRGHGYFTASPHKLLDNNNKRSAHSTLFFSDFLTMFMFFLVNNYWFCHRRGLCGLFSISSNTYWPSQSRLLGSSGICAY